MRRHATALLASGAAIVLSLVGCSADDGAAPSPSASPTATEEPTPAEALLPQFADVLAANDVADQPNGGGLVDALVAAGFDPAAIERSADVDQQGQPVALMAVAVRVDGECLLGQVGNGTPTSLVGPVLGTGTCLVAPSLP